ncbi:DUF4199 domain-containing protein [Ochrovirga pacifica]|uniref:DUF4199 domain-containing protein n=1 Tax=Ochrovirga pacifica TaxID=1042376 RepID=UPI0002557B89|nr:DUF4199 domain-containing protein [Ochrovirga pacifica]
MNSFFSSKPILKFGLISGFLIVLNELIIYATTGSNPYISERTSIFSALGLIIPIVVIMVAINYLKKHVGFTSFGQIIKPGLIIGALTAFVYIVYSLLFIYNIEPDTLTKFEAMNRERLVATGNFENPENLKNAIQLANNAFIPGTILFSLAVNLFIGFLAAVVTGIFVKNK